jgi:hypothetical protein
MAARCGRLPRQDTAAQGVRGMALGCWGLAARLDAGDSFSGHRLTVAARLGRTGTVAGTHRAMTLRALLVRSAAGSLDRAIADTDRRWAASRLSVAGLRRMPRTAKGTGSWAVRRAGIA